MIIAREAAAAVRRKRGGEEGRYTSLREKRAVSFANLLITRDATASDEFLINTTVSRQRDGKKLRYMAIIIT